jgi:predicted transcriptional regulator
MARDMLVFDSDPTAAAPLAVGTSCRICAHAACPQRREPSVIES